MPDRPISRSGHSARAPSAARETRALTGLQRADRATEGPHPDPLPSDGRGEGFSITRPDLSIVMVSWNARSHLVDCLKSIEDTASGLAYEVIVVDNDSSHGSPEAVRQGGFRNVCLVDAGANLGFPKGN